MDNLEHLESLEPDVIVSTLGTRYQLDEIYTHIGAILVSVNPFKKLPIYSPEHLEKFGVNAASEAQKPHIFGVGRQAFRSLLGEGVSQAIVISGESGSGKTEATKFILQYLSHVASQGSRTDVDNEILASNPLLEAFGNAKTVCNNNSSRFGKWISLHFTRGGALMGANIQQYLLEKSRVVQQASNERNFHVFYQLTRGADEATRRQFGIKSVVEYSYLNQSGCLTVDSVSDQDEWKATLESMTKLRFTEADIQGVIEVLTVVLNLGNIKFGEGDKQQGVIANPEQLAQAANLLHVSPSLLEAALLTRKVAIRGDDETKALLQSSLQATNARDALAKELYARLFDYLVTKVNQPLACDEAKVFKDIGVLDIFGFEIFTENSLEQLFINYANETLQQYFNGFIFKQEQQEYKHDEVDVAYVEFVDNQPVLDLIEGKKGLLRLLDDELIAPNGSDASYLAKMMGQYGRKGHPCFEWSKRQGAFIVRHYAGDVQYSVAGMMEKNKDKLHESLQELCRSSSSVLIKGFFPAEEEESARLTRSPSLVVEQFLEEETPRSRVAAQTIALKQRDVDASHTRNTKVAQQRRGPTTLGTTFTSQLRNLNETLKTMAPHFVRCVQPNVNKLNNLFVPDVIIPQLKNAGLFEVVRIRKLGFPLRKTHEGFVASYGCLSSDLVQLKKVQLNSRQMCEALIASIGTQTKIKPEDLRVGKTKVFFKASAQAALEDLRGHQTAGKATLIQSRWRQYRCRKRFKTVLLPLHRSAQRALASKSKSDAVAALELAKKHKVEMPILVQVCELLKQLESGDKLIASLNAACSPPNNGLSDDALDKWSQEAVTKITQAVALAQAQKGALPDVLAAIARAEATLVKIKEDTATRTRKREEERKKREEERKKREEEIKKQQEAEDKRKKEEVAQKKKEEEKRKVEEEEQHKKEEEKKQAALKDLEANKQLVEENKKKADERRAEEERKITEKKPPEAQAKVEAVSPQPVQKETPSQPSTPKEALKDPKEPPKAKVELAPVKDNRPQWRIDMDNRMKAKKEAEEAARQNAPPKVPLVDTVPLNAFATAHYRRVSELPSLADLLPPKVPLAAPADQSASESEAKRGAEKVSGKATERGSQTSAPPPPPTKAEQEKREQDEKLRQVKALLEPKKDPRPQWRIDLEMRQKAKREEEEREKASRKPKVPSVDVAPVETFVAEHHRRVSSATDLLPELRKDSLKTAPPPPARPALEMEKAAKDKAERERIDKLNAIKVESAKLEKEKVEKEKLEKDKLEKANTNKDANRAIKEKAEKDILEKSKAPLQRQGSIIANKSESDAKLEKEKLEKSAKEKLEKDKADKEKSEKELKEKTERDRLEKEKNDKKVGPLRQTSVVALTTEKEKAEKEKAEKEKAVKELAEKAKLELDKKVIAPAKSFVGSTDKEKAKVGPSEKPKPVELKAKTVAEIDKEKADKEKVDKTNTEKLQASKVADIAKATVTSRSVITQTVKPVPPKAAELDLTPTPGSPILEHVEKPQAAVRKKSPKTHKAFNPKSQVVEAKKVVGYGGEVRAPATNSLPAALPQSQAAARKPMGMPMPGGNAMMAEMAAKRAAKAGATQIKK